MTDTKKIPPRIYHRHDIDGILAIWKMLTDTVNEQERQFQKDFQEIVDPDTAPIDFVQLQLAQLGNPFNINQLTETQLRKLVKLLIPIYNQKGFARGIINTMRFLTGIEVVITDPHGIENETWQVEIDEIGYSTFVGGKRRFCNLLRNTEDFNAATWVKNNCTVTSDQIVGPSPWGRLADSIDMSIPGSSISQVVTPRHIYEQDFTGSIWLKSETPTDLILRIQSVEDPLVDYIDTVFNLTSTWQRFEAHHTTLADAEGDINFELIHQAGFVGNIYLWGAHLVRDEFVGSYTEQGDELTTDCEKPGSWIYHFLIYPPVPLTDIERQILIMITDYMKTAHTHYTIIEP